MYLVQNISLLVLLFLACVPDDARRVVMLLSRLLFCGLTQCLSLSLDFHQVNLNIYYM